MLTFSDHLRLINERSAAFRAAVAAAPSLDALVPTHPERTLSDLVRHVGMGRRKSAAIVAAGPADAPPETSAWDDGLGVPREREALLTWWTESVEHLTSVLREAGPDRGCWTWWDDSPSPQTSGAWARRQVPEIAVFTYDAQLTGGSPQPLPEEVALDGAQAAHLAPAAGGDPDTVDASARGTASELVLFFYGRVPLESLDFEGDRRIFDQLAAWGPSV